MPLLIIRQDITKMQVDAIVNTTNEKTVGYSWETLSTRGHRGLPLKTASWARSVNKADAC